MRRRRLVLGAAAVVAVIGAAEAVAVAVIWRAIGAAFEVPLHPPDPDLLAFRLAHRAEAALAFPILGPRDYIGAIAP